MRPDPPGGILGLMNLQQLRQLDDDAAAVRRIHLGRLAVTIAVVWLAATVVFVILGFFGESEESGTALRLL